jgi:putative transposase
MCALLEVSSGGFYDWVKRPESERSKRHQKLVAKISKSHQASGRIYGSPRIHKDLQESGEIVGVNTVALLMRRKGIQSKVHKRFVVTTDSRRTMNPAPNTLDREFEAERPNQKWVSDVTFIPTREGWLYLATIMDLYSRMIVGWAMKPSNSTELILEALDMALEQRGKPSSVLLHSDQGAQYASSNYQKELSDNQLICSMSRKGNCWDNAPMESFYHSLKTEWVCFEDYRTRSQARTSLFQYIELFYNRNRRHSSINYQSPMAYEQTNGVH